jgi:hypothetical protein
MRHMAAVAGVLVVAVLAGTAVLGAPAHASPPTGNLKQIAAGLSSCPKGYFCAWRDPNYSGPGVAFEGNADHWHHLGGLSFIDDNASSMYNNGYATNPSAVRMWVDVGFNGVSGCMSVGTKNPDLQDAYDNKISSHQWVNSCSGPRPPATRCVYPTPSYYPTGPDAANLRLGVFQLSVPACNTNTSGWPAASVVEARTNATGDNLGFFITSSNVRISSSTASERTYVGTLGYRWCTPRIGWPCWTSGNVTVYLRAWNDGGVPRVLYTGQSRSQVTDAVHFEFTP